MQLIVNSENVLELDCSLSKPVKKGLSAYFNNVLDNRLQ